ncbi:PH domain-containing protein [Streptomyces sp. NPDC086777]|uniref:PH domain-containing protein n=1 Tax=Streptomyces sp. NPDC086777 TaxID=3154866 RepID=UPI00344E640B
MDEGGVEREYRRRRKPHLAYLLLPMLLMMNAFIQTSRVSHDDDRGGSGFWWGPPAVALLLAMTVVRIALEYFRAYTRVTAAGITAQGPVRARSWAWSEVYDIRVEQAQRGSGRTAPQWLTYLYDIRGRRFLLWHLNDWQVDDPYAEVAELCLAAAPLRSLTWERRPDVEELILRGAARRKAVTWGLYGWLAVFCLMLVVDIWRAAVGGPDHPFLLMVCVPLASGVALAAVLDRYWSIRPPRSPARQP